MTPDDLEVPKGVGRAALALLRSMLSDVSRLAPGCQVGEDRTVALEVPALWDGAAFQALLHQETVPLPLLSRARAALGNAAGVSVSAAGLWDFMALQFGVFLLAVCHLVRPLAASPYRLAWSMLGFLLAVCYVQRLSAAAPGGLA